LGQNRPAIPWENSHEQNNYSSGLSQHDATSQSATMVRDPSARPPAMAGDQSLGISLETLHFETVSKRQFPLTKRLVESMTGNDGLLGGNDFTDNGTAAGSNAHFSLRSDFLPSAGAAEPVRSDSR
jgi:hypothetical protein